MLQKEVVLTFKLHKLSLLKHPKKVFEMRLDRNKKYVFEFQKDAYWNDKKMAAEFSDGDLICYSPIINGQCEVPFKVQNALEFYLVVIGEDEYGNRCRTNKNKIIQIGGT